MEHNEKKSVGKVVISILRVLIYLALVTILVLAVFSEDIMGDSKFTDAVKEIFSVENMLSLLPIVIKTLVFVVIADLFGKFIRLFLDKIIKKSNKNIAMLSILKNAVKYLTAIVIVFIILASFGVNVTTLFAGLGIFSLAIGLGAQSVIEDIIAGLFIVFEKTFLIGDIVEINGFKGKVKEINMRTVKIVDVGGNVKTVNNAKINDIVNLTDQLSTAICDIEIEYGESLERVESILASEMANLELTIENTVKGPYYVGVSQLGTSGVQLKFIASCVEGDRVGVERQMNRQLVLLFEKHNISIPYPHIVVNDDRKFSKVTDEEQKVVKNFIEEQKTKIRNM